MSYPKRIFPVFLALLLSACSMRLTPVSEEPAYWQRTRTTSSLYLQGPKTQQMLQKDIADCNAEIYELKRIGAIHKQDSRVLRNKKKNRGDAAEEKTDQWKTAENRGYMSVINKDYHDFGGCMAARGWRPVEHLPHKFADR